MKLADVNDEKIVSMSINSVAEFRLSSNEKIESKSSVFGTREEEKSSELVDRDKEKLVR